MASNSLADDLLADLENDSDEDMGDEDEAGPSTNGTGAAGAEGDDGDEAPGEVTDDMLLPSGGVKPAEELDPEAVKTMELAGVAEVGKVAKLARGKLMKDVLTVRF